MKEWLIQISYTKEGLLVNEKAHINFKSVNAEINAIEERINQVLDTNNEVSICIEWLGNIEHTIKVDFSGGKAHIYNDETTVRHVTSEEARRILGNSFLQMKRK